MTLCCVPGHAEVPAKGEGGYVVQGSEHEGGPRGEGAEELASFTGCPLQALVLALVAWNTRARLRNREGL